MAAHPGGNPLLDRQRPFPEERGGIGEGMAAATDSRVFSAVSLRLWYAPPMPFDHAAALLRSHEQAEAALRSALREHQLGHYPLAPALAIYAARCAFTTVWIDEYDALPPDWLDLAALSKDVEGRLTPTGCEWLALLVTAEQMLQTDALVLSDPSVREQLGALLTIAHYFITCFTPRASVQRE